VLWKESNHESNEAAIQRVWSEAFVYLTYWDDSGSDARSEILVFGGIVVPTEQFRMLEFRHANAVKRLIPPDRRTEFAEFHAFELMNGHGVFEGLSLPDRRLAAETLLHGLQEMGLTYFYSAVHKAKLRSSGEGSADPIDVAFRMCLGALDKWASAPVHTTPDYGAPKPFLAHWMNDVCLVVVDDGDNGRNGNSKLHSVTFAHAFTLSTMASG
jgi:hypothetical protein